MPRRPAWNPVALARTVALHRKLGGVGKGSDFPGVLVVLLGKCPLGIGIPIVVDHALDVARGHWTESQRLQIPQKRHRHARFVPIGVRDDHSGLVRLSLQNRAEQRIEFGVDQNYMLAVIKRVEHNAQPRRSTVPVTSIRRSMASQAVSTDGVVGQYREPAARLLFRLPWRSHALSTP